MDNIHLTENSLIRNSWEVLFAFETFYCFLHLKIFSKVKKSAWTLLILSNGSLESKKEKEFKSHPHKHAFSSRFFFSFDYISKHRYIDIEKKSY